MFGSLFVFFFKQKTAYEVRISDWSSDVCSSDLAAGLAGAAVAGDALGAGRDFGRAVATAARRPAADAGAGAAARGDAECRDGWRRRRAATGVRGRRAGHALPRRAPTPRRTSAGTAEPPTRPCQALRRNTTPTP